MNNHTQNHSLDIGNLLRCFATMFVFLLHGRSNIPKLEEADVIFKIITCLPAWSGVWIFLFLSGYGIGIGFFKKRYNFECNNNITTIKGILKFYLHRFLKIAPLYYIYCFIFELMSGQLYFWNNPQYLFKILTFTFNGNGGISGIGHLWYVSTAMQLYLLMPFIYLLIDRVRKIRICKIILFVVCGLGLITRIIIYNEGMDWYTYIYTNFITNIDIIICGICISKLSLNLVKTKKPNPFAKYFSLGMFLILVYYNCYIYYYGTSNFMFIYQCVLPSLYILACSALFLSWNEQAGSSVSTKITLFSKAINNFAKQSYAFYIFHIIVFKYLSTTLIPSEFYTKQNAYMQYFIFFSIAFVLTYCASYTLNTSFAKLTNIKGGKQNV